VAVDNVLCVELLREDIAAENTLVEHLPVENRSYQAKPYRDF
jgi:hypothetical protein